MDDELLTLIQRTISEDARQRVDRILTRLRTYRDPVVDRIGHPTHGVCETVEAVPPFRKSHNIGAHPYSFEYNGQVYWLRIPGDHGSTPPWLLGPECTYNHTAYLDYVLWKGYQKDPIGPRVPHGYSLEALGNKRGDHKFLMEEGCTVTYKYFLRHGEIASIDRAYSLGFISTFGLPGQEPVDFDSLDEQLRFLHSLPSHSEPDRPMISRGNKEDQTFLASLKTQCLAIRDKSGPSHSRAAFEIYKSVAKYLSPDSV
jgi:hypothetical protein